MLGISRIPPRFRRALATFEDAFTDERNVSSFLTLTSALIYAESQWSVAALARGISHPDGKSREAYDYFLGDAAWTARALANQLLVYLFARLNVSQDDHLLLLIDDTFVGKSGDATDGVADLYNPATGEKEWGNKFVTSTLQIDGVYVPYRAVMYIPEHLSGRFDQPFRTKLEIALEEIITPLQLPAGAACTVVFDSAYCAADVLGEVCHQGYDVVTRLKSDTHVQPPESFGTVRVRDFADSLELTEVTITVRGEDTTYLAADSRIHLPNVGGAKLVVTEVDDTRRYYVSTNLDLSVVEILEYAEDRWNIETVHQESNAKFGFDQYELERKQAIERFLQVGFVAWTIVTLESDLDEALWTDRGGLSARLDQAKETFLVETLLDLSELLAPSRPEAERRKLVSKFVSDRSWSGSVVKFISEFVYLIGRR